MDIIKWALFHRANHYRTLVNNEPRSVSQQPQFRWRVRIVVAYFHPVSEFCIHGSLFESVINIRQHVKVSALLHLVVEQRSERNLNEAAAETRCRKFVGVYEKRIERSCDGVPICWALIRNDGILDFHLKKVMAD
jgi:hypothetical protein